MARKPHGTAARWLARQQSEDCDHARAYLGLLLPPRDAAALAAALAKAPVVQQAAKDIVRAARIVPLPPTNAKVAIDLKKIARGKPLPPILLVRGDAGRDLPLIVADGMHRLSAAWHADESGPVACCLVKRR
jgi:hypothetical protein